MSRRAGWRVLAAALMVACSVLPVFADANDAPKRLAEAKEVYQQLVSAPDRGVPKELLEHARAIAVFPGVLKAAMGVGARHGKGVMTVRTANGWSAPAIVSISGGSAGFQLGAESTDLVLFFMNDRGVKSIINGSKITLGGKASVAAGPIGRSGEAATNLELKAEIYSYARSKGLFAGLSIEGARIAPDNKENGELYGAGVTAKKVLLGGGPATRPAAATDFLSVLP
jgi:lipid-binding SYLF domain-containing protein